MTNYIKNAMTNNSLRIVCVILLTITIKQTYAYTCYWEYEVPLISAALAGKTEEVKRLISKGTDINEQYYQPVGIAYYSRKRQEVEGPTALMVASWKGHEEIVELLINEGADLNKVSMCNKVQHYTPYCDIPDSRNAVMLAAEKGHCKIIGMLMHAGASPYGTRSCDEALFDCLDKLIETEDLDYDKQGFNGESILMMAIYKHQNNMVDKLIERGANLDLEDDCGYTGLMVACLMGDTRTVRELIQAGANVNAVAKNGETAASVALKHRHTNCLEQLILNDASVHVNDLVELKSLLNMKINLNAKIGKNLKLILGEKLSSEFDIAIIAGDIETVKKLAPSYLGSWGICSTVDREVALALAALTEQTEILNYLCDLWDVPKYPSEKNTLEIVLEWLCFLEPTNLYQYLK